MGKQYGQSLQDFPHLFQLLCYSLQEWVLGFGGIIPKQKEHR